MKTAKNKQTNEVARDHTTVHWIYEFIVNQTVSIYRRENFFFGFGGFNLKEL